jgi:CubicO group peptidase (beta-lactamase class C family)
VALLVLALVLTGPVAGARAAPLDGLDASLTAALPEWSLPGLAVAVVKDDRVVHVQGHGTRRLGAAEPVGPDTTFNIGSATRAFTATALALLVDRGRLAWDDPVVKHLPGFRLASEYVTREIRVRDLLANRVGISPLTDGLWYGADHGRAEIIRRLRFVPLDGGSRYRYGYRNVMFLVAGEIIPAVTGRSFDAFVTDELLRPLGMTRSMTSHRELPRFEDVATPHVVAAAGTPVSVPHRDIAKFTVLDGRVATLSDGMLEYRPAR